MREVSRQQPWVLKQMEDQRYRKVSEDQQRGKKRERRGIDGGMEWSVSDSNGVVYLFIFA